MTPRLAMNTIRLFALIALAPLICLKAAKLTDSISDEEFKAAGLDKLTPEELAILNDLWSRENPAPSETALAQAATPPPTTPAIQASAGQSEDLVGKEQIAVDTRKAPKKFESRLEGTFEGWYGNTIFHLENGQVWQQRISKVQKYSATENPKVTVFKTMGGYRMRVEGYRQTCPVKRIK